MQSALQNVGSEGMIDTGTCNIHVVHNSFSKGKEIFGSSVELATCLFSFFKYSAAGKILLRYSRVLGSYISAVTPIFFGHCVVDRLVIIKGRGMHDGCPSS